MNGRIWVAWNPKALQIQFVEEHELALHCEILDVYTGKCQQLVVVYTLNSGEQRKSLWEFVNRKLQQIVSPLLMGWD